MPGIINLSEITPDKIAAARLAPEMFGLYLRKLAEQHGDGLGKADPYFAAFAVFVEEKGIEPGSGESVMDTLDDHLLMQAMTSRFFALLKLEKDGHLKNWTTDENKAGLVLLHPSLAFAACEATLLFHEEQSYFQPLEFLDHALKHAEPNEPFRR